jgi:hypothetical protein
VECPKCHASNRQDANFCCACGERIKEGELLKTDTLPQSARFCNQCGSNLTEIEKTSPGNDVVKKKRLGFFLECTPLYIAIIALCFATYLYFSGKPTYVDYQSLLSGKLTDAQKQTISTSTDLNKYFISLATLMFAALGFYLTKYKRCLSANILGAALILVVVLLAGTYFFGVRAYCTMVSELAQNALAVDPGYSWLLFYLEMGFWTSVCAGLTMLCIFVFVFIQDKGTAQDKAPDCIP